MKIKRFNENIDNELDPYGEEDWSGNELNLDNFDIENVTSKYTVFRVKVNLLDNDIHFDVCYNDAGDYIYHNEVNIDDLSDEIINFLEENYAEISNKLTLYIGENN